MISGGVIPGGMTGAGLLLAPPAPGGLLPPAWLAGLEGALTAGLLALCLIVHRVDLRRMIIPDSVGLLLLLTGLLHAWVIAGAPVSGGAWQVIPESAVLGACLFGWGFFLLRTLFSWLFGTEALGLGDVKLAFGAGAWLGGSLFLPYLLASSLAALVIWLLITLGRLGRPLHARPGPDGPGARAWLAAWCRQRLRPPRAFPYGPAMAIGLAGLVLAGKAGLLTGLFGLDVVWSLYA
jgi:prepilin signal peptidase PulO-like enzyme (type II secretory pathway)